MPRVLGLVLQVAWQFRVISPRRCIWKKFPDQTEFQSWVVNFRADVCAKAKNLALALQWIKEIEAASSLKDLINPKSITGKDFSDYEELDLMMAAELKRRHDKYPHFQKRIRVEEQRAQKDNQFLRGSQIAYLIYEYFRSNEITEHGAVTKGKGQNSYTERKTGECFQRKTIWSCSRRDTCSFLQTHATGDRESTREEVVDARRSRLERASYSVPKVKEQTDVKSSKSLEASPATGAEILCLWWAKCKRSSCDYRHPPVCRGYKSGNRCIYGHRCLFRHADGEKANPARGREKKVLKEQLLFWGKKGPRLCISKLRSKEVSSAQSRRIGIERFGGTHHKILRTRVVRNSNSGKRRAISRRYPKRWTSWAKSLRAQVWGKNTWGNLKTRRVCPQSSIGLLEKKILGQGRR